MPLLLIQALWELPSSRNQGYRKPYDWRAWRALHHTLLCSWIWPGLSPGGGDQSPGPNCFSSWPQQQMVFFMSFRKKTGEATDWTKSPMPGVALKATCSVRDDPECKDALWTRGEQEDPSENTERERRYHQDHREWGKYPSRNYRMSHMMTSNYETIWSSLKFTVASRVTMDNEIHLFYWVFTYIISHNLWRTNFEKIPRLIFLKNTLIWIARKLILYVKAICNKSF